MRRSLLVASLLAVACFSERGIGDGTASDASTSGASTSTDAEAGSASTTTSSTATADGSTTATADGSTTATATCSWALEWAGTDRKDILVVVQRPPTNLGAVMTRAAEIAEADGVHIAVASACDESCGCCGEEGDGFEHHTSTVIDDPLAQAAALELSPAFFREGVPRHVVLLAMNDTTWTPAMLAGDPRFASAQIDVRGVDTADCGATPTLDGLAEATHGSVACGDLEAPDILDDAVLLAAQPACELFGDPAMGPPPGPIELALELAGTADGAPTSSQPAGPGVCRNAPAGWSIVDSALGHLALCPVACRDVGDWAPRSLGASVEFPC